MDVDEKGDVVVVGVVVAAVNDVVVVVIVARLEVTGVVGKG